MNFTQRTIRKQIIALKQSFLQVEALPLSDVLPEDTLRNIAQTAGNYRDKIFSPLNTLKVFIWQVLSDNGSCKEAVANLLVERTLQGKSANSISTGPYCKARHRLPLSLLIDAVLQTGRALHQKATATWMWCGYNVVMVDGTTVLAADTIENQAAFPQQSNQKPGLGFPIARIVGLISLSTGSMIDYALSSYKGKGTGEASLFSQIVGSLTSGDLLLADRYYCTYGIVASLLERCTPILVKNHANKKVDFRKGQRLGPKDHLIYWEKPKRKPVWMSVKDYKELPPTLQIREFSVKGEVYVTTLLDAKKHSKQDLAALYKERWKVELDFRSIKTDMKMEMLRCKTPEMVKKEIAVHFLAYNLIRTNIAQGASEHNILPRTISFKATVQLVSAAMRQLLFNSKKQLVDLYTVILKAIASTRIAQRKRKPQPRAVKRRPKPYPLLMEPREVACLALMLGLR